MTRTLSRKSSFTSGEISSELYGRSELNAYRNGAKTLCNVLVRPTGGVRRRPGLAHVAMTMEAGRLIPFEINAEQSYILHLYPSSADIYRDGKWVAKISRTPWRQEHIAGISWIQDTDSLLLTHPDFEPYLIRYQGEQPDGSEIWGHRFWQFDTEGDFTHEPFFRFIKKDSDRRVTMRFTSKEYTTIRRRRTLTATVACSRPMFHPMERGRRWLIDGIQCKFLKHVSRSRGNTLLRTAKFQIIGRKEKTNAGYQINTNPTITLNQLTTDWQESAFSDVRGWPRCCTFYQSRMIIGGSKSIPNRIWMSRPARHWNFDTGWGQANNAIIFDLLSDQANDIRTLFAGRHLQIFTSGAEWVVTADVLTPTGLTVKRQSRIGIFNKRWLPPSNIDGATVFIDRSGHQVREFLYTDIEQAYQTTDLALLSSHMIMNPVDQAFDPGQRHLYIPLADGTMAVATIHRAEQVTGWSLLKTAGKFLSIAVSGGHVYVLVARERRKESVVQDQATSYPSYRIERFDSDIHFDAATTANSATAKRQWSDFAHLRDCPSTRVLADGVAVKDAEVDPEGNLTLGVSSRQCTAGLPYTHTVIPLPPAEGYLRMRLIQATFHVEHSASLTADTGQGYQTIRFFRAGQSPLGTTDRLRTETIRLRGSSWHSGERPLWQIRQDTPAPFSLLSVTSEIKVVR